MTDLLHSNEYEKIYSSLPFFTHVPCIQVSVLSSRWWLKVKTIFGKTQNTKSEPKTSTLFVMKSLEHHSIHTITGTSSKLAHSAHQFTSSIFQILCRVMKPKRQMPYSAGRRFFHDAFVHGLVGQCVLHPLPQRAYQYFSGSSTLTPSLELKRYIVFYALNITLATAGINQLFKLYVYTAYPIQILGPELKERNLPCFLKIIHSYNYSHLLFQFISVFKLTSPARKTPSCYTSKLLVKFWALH